MSQLNCSTDEFVAMQQYLSKINVFLVFVVRALGIKIKYGPHLSLEMQILAFKEEIDKNQKEIYEFCDKAFKLFGWSIALGVASKFWKSTIFVSFLIVTIILGFALLVYIIVLSTKLAYYISEKIGKKNVNPKITAALMVFMITIFVFLLPNIFIVALGKLNRAQACSIYNKSSPNIPPECRKLVRL